MNIAAPKTIITRFAPSPTGLLHLGNVRTALLNYLFAHQQGGKFLLRFEDTDQSRSQDEFITAIKNDLMWLGLPWDGEVRFQSAHAEAHQQALQQLAAKDKAYPCFCTEHQLNLDRKLASARGLPPRYQGRCRLLSAEERQTRRENEPHVWRLAIHASDESRVDVVDVLRGSVQFQRRDLDDPVVVRSDGTFTFLLPNAVDDALDGITHTLRGDDHLTNSAYQVWLLQELGHTPPLYLHHGLLLGKDGAKLSKRTGSHNVTDLRNEGLLPDALIQSMARLGHPNISDEASSITALAQAFQPEHISTASVRWSDDGMWRQHTRLLHTLDIQQLAAMIAPHLPAGNDDRIQPLATLIQPNLQQAGDAAIFTRLLDAEYPLQPDGLTTLADSGHAFFQTALKTWGSHAGDWKAWTQAIRSETGAKGRALFMPLRLALTGCSHGPEMLAVINFLGNAGVEQRLKQTIKELEARS